MTKLEFVVPDLSAKYFNDALRKAYTDREFARNGGKLELIYNGTVTVHNQPPLINKLSDIEYHSSELHEQLEDDWRDGVEYSDETQEYYDNLQKEYEEDWTALNEILEYHKANRRKERFK